MALNPVLKLQILAQAKAAATRVRNHTAAELQMLTSANPLAAAQLQTLFAPVDADLATALANIATAQTSTTVTDADRVAFAQQAETDAKT